MRRLTEQYFSEILGSILRFTFAQYHVQRERAYKIADSLKGYKKWLKIRIPILGKNIKLLVWYTLDTSSTIPSLVMHYKTKKSKNEICIINIDTPDIFSEEHIIRLQEDIFDRVEMSLKSWNANTLSIERHKLIKFLKKLAE